MKLNEPMPVYVCSMVDTQHRSGVSHTNSETVGSWKEVHEQLSEFLKDRDLTRMMIIKETGIRKDLGDGIYYCEVTHDE